MLSLVVNDVAIEVDVKYKNATIHHYMVTIVGYETIEISGPREFSAMLAIIEAEVLYAIANIDAGMHYA